MKKTNESRESHALDGIEFEHKTPDWEDRVREWNKPMSFDARMQWLHTNGVREGNGPEKVIFYLGIADRYSELNLFIGNGNTHCSLSEGSISEKQMRRKLAQKAFAVLTNVFLRQENDYSGFPLSLPYSEPLFSKLLWFFRPFGGLGGWDNLRPRDTTGLGRDGGRHYIDLANKFAGEFAFDAWQLLNDCWSKCWEGSPYKHVTYNHESEIIMLMRRLNKETCMQGQYKPLPNILYRMTRMVIEEYTGKPVFDGNLRDKKYVEGILRLAVKTQNPFARLVYLVRVDAEV